MVENRPISTHPPEFCAIVGGSPIGVSPRSSATENYIPDAIVFVRRWLRDPIFARFDDSIPACDGQIDRETDEHIHDDSIYRAHMASHGNNGSRDQTTPFLKMVCHPRDGTS